MATVVDETILERHLKKTTIISNLLSVFFGVITALAFGYGFYYRTTDTLESHTKEIQEVQSSVKKLTEAVNSSAVFEGASKEQIKALQDQVNDVKNSQRRIEDKIDKLLIK